MSPEYAIEGIFSIKSDVFSFGVLLLEIVSGKKNTGFYQTASLNLLGYVRKKSSWFSLSPFVLFNTTLFIVVRDLKLNTYFNMILNTELIKKKHMLYAINN